MIKQVLKQEWKEEKKKKREKKIGVDMEGITPMGTNPWTQYSTIFLN